MTLAQYFTAIIDACMAALCGVTAVSVFLKRANDPKSATVLTGALVAGLLFDTAELFMDYYHRQSDGTRILLILVELATLIVLIQMIRQQKLFRRRDSRKLVYMAIFLVIATVLQMAMPDLSISSIAVSAAILISAASFQREAADTTMVRESLKLTNENIFLVFKGLDQFMKYLDMEMLNRFKVRMTAEEVLLRMKDRFGEEEEFDIFAFISFGRPQIRIEKKGELFNPLSKTEVERGNWSGSMLLSIGLNPVFSYAGGRNILKLPLERREMNPAVKMLIALAIGLIVGFLGVSTLSAEDQLFFSEEVLRPIYDLFSNLLFCVSGPILFFMVVNVILDAASISEQGGSSLFLVSRYLIFSFLIGLVAMAVVVCLMGHHFEALILARKDVHTLLTGLLSVVPRDVFSPFVDANTPQLLLMAIVLGVAIVTLGSSANGLNAWNRQGNLVGMQMSRWIGGFIPYFAIVMAALLYMSGRQIDLLRVLLVMLASILITLVCMGAILWYVSVREHVSPRILLKKCWPSFINSLKSGTLDTSYGLSERCCMTGFGIERNFVSNTLPLGLVMYMPANVVGTLLFVMYAVARSDVTITPLWMVLSVLLAVIMFVATPPIPGANFLAYIVMISVLGFHADFLMLALIFEIIYGDFASPANQFFVQMEMILQAKKLGLIREKALQKG